MSSAVVLDTNVIVALLDAGDSLHAQATELLQRMQLSRVEAELLDVLVFEALSVLTRRATERKRAPPDLRALVGTIRSFFEKGAVRWVSDELAPRWPEVLNV